MLHKKSGDENRKTIWDTTGGQSEENKISCNIYWIISLPASYCKTRRSK